jgi:hypothetical protein
VKNSQFLGLAETRVAHLRQLSHHLRALEWDTASLAEVEREIPELDSAMAVYRRLHSVPSGTDEADAAPARGAATSAPAAKPAAKARPAARRPAARRGATRRRASADPPSFKEFALKHLDALNPDAAEGSVDAAATANGVRGRDNGAGYR